MIHRFVAGAARALVLVAVASPGCKSAPKPGEPCAGGQGACVDASSMVACIKGSFVAMPCAGPAGCKAKGTVSDCDNSLASAGTACDELGDYACSLDKKTALTCKENKFVVDETCKGPGACTLKADGLYCDNDVADLGDPCHTPGDYACTSDKKLALKCGGDHTMIAINSCKGAAGCRVVEHPEDKRVEFVCDDALADAEDPCDEEEERACTQDRKGLLKCTGHKFLAEKSCARGCAFDGSSEKFECDDGAASAAAPAKRAGKKGR